MATDLKHVVDALTAERKRIAQEEPGGGNLHLRDQLSHVIETVELTQAVCDLLHTGRVGESGVLYDGRSLGMAIWDLF